MHHALTLPNFFIVGAAKAGTSSLAAYLGQHPDIFIPYLKEPNYFALSGRQAMPNGPASPEVMQALLYNWSETDLTAYTDLFAGSGRHRARGEASVRYLYFPDAPANIAHAIPVARIVAVLREPVGRAYSHYLMNVQKQLEPLPFRDALDREEDRIADGWGWDWHYAAVSRYAPQLARYFAVFGREQVAVHLYEDFRDRPVETIRAIARHLGVDAEGFTPDMRLRGKVAARPRSLWLDRVCHWPHPLKTRLAEAGLDRPVTAALTRLGKLNQRPAPALPAADRAALAERFRTDIAALSDLLGRDLPW